MSHRFSDIPAFNRVLIDTNVLLSAVLIEDSVARRAVDALRSLGHSVICEEMSHLEAARRLEQAHRRLRLPYDPNAVFDHLIQHLGALFLPPGDPAIPTGIRKHDRHIPRAAADFGTWVMTDDVELQIALTTAGFEARNSYETMLAAATAGVASAGSAPLPPRIPANAPGPARGWVMAWVTPGGWAGGVPSGYHTVIDIPNFARIFYDTSAARWRAEFRFAAKTLDAPIVLHPDVPVAVSIGFDGLRVPGKLCVAAGSPSGSRVYERNNTLSNIPVYGLQGASLGHTVANDSYWDGNIRRLSTGDRFISRDARTVMVFGPSLDVAGEPFLPTASCRFPAVLRSVTTEDFFSPRHRPERSGRQHHRCL
jgi:hypothetical protein